MRLSILTALLFFILHVYNVSAQGNNYQFSQLNVSNGLSHNQVKCIYKDAKGFMWFGTMSGLNRYDGYNFRVFRHNSYDSLSLVDDGISRISELPANKLLIQGIKGNSVYDPLTESFINATAYLQKTKLPSDNLLTTLKQGNNFWFIYAYALYKLDASNRITVISHVSNNGSSIDAEKIADAKTDIQNNLIIIHCNGILEKLNPNTNNVIFRTGVIQKQMKDSLCNFSIFTDAQNDVWLYSTAYTINPFGVLYYNAFTNQVKHLSKENGILNNNLIGGIIQDNRGLIWIGTDHGGINIIDKNSFKPIYLTNKEGDAKSVAENSIPVIYKDNLGIIWAGTFKKGISYYAENTIKFELFRHLQSNRFSLPYDDVNKFAEDAKENIWIGTNGGGLIYFDRHGNKFTQFKHDPNNTNSVGNDVIVSMYIDRDQKLWIGSYYGGLDCYDGKKFTHYRHDASNPKTISDDRVWEIYEDKNNNFWIGTLAGGLERFDRGKNIFYHNNPSTPNSIHSNYISSFAEDNDGNLWIGTSDGIDMLQKSTGRFIHYTNEENKLSNDNVNALIKDFRGNIWIGTRDGLSIFDPKTKLFHVFRIKDGLPDNTVMCIVEDNDHHLWISTPAGISKISVVQNGNCIKIYCRNYDEKDGLQGHAFNENASLKTKKGELIFGGPDGFNIFNPSEIKGNKNIPPVVLTDLQVFNKFISVGEKINDHVILQLAVPETKEIVLNYNENIFSIDFAALSFANSGKNKYAYILEGFNKDWVIADSKTRRATYTNLNPGEYTFRVKASNDEGVWNEQGTMLKIKILPPFWKTSFAYIIYILIIATILFFARGIVIQRARMRFALEQQRKEAQRLHELDMMKTRFFTNVSHEFRTPLSLILTPLDKIIKNTSEPEQKKQFQLIHRNARRLLNLLNQLLDFRKMEVQELRLNATKGDAVKFVKDICCSFNDIAEKKNIHFSYGADCKHLVTLFDHDKLERILFNLLSNAFKFTPDYGKVNVEVNLERKADEALLKIKVKDTGIGIPSEKQNKIFERFFQNEVPDTLVNQGSGIGLAITKEFVRMHEGFINVESEVNKGSCFTVVLPFKEIQEDFISKPLYEGGVTSEMSVYRNNVPVKNALEVLQENGITKDKKSTVLIVEDNEDFRLYLKDNLREFYNIVEAENGKAGWQKTLSVHPDLIVCDISMPLMNGIDLCKKIKSDQRTRHIPVILLTAFNGEDHQLNGLQTGASDYMVKPFNLEIMLSKIRNILKQQQTIRETYVRQIQVKTSEVKIESANDKFIQQALTVVEKHISNTDFSVKELSRELFMSRVAVYKRLFSLTGKTPIEFIRSIRLQRATQLLEKTEMTVAEVAYEVGFNNPKYFTKYFKAEFNIVPSAYAAEKRKEAEMHKKKSLQN
jgi:signal transduction histidine kinase/ligand-binding sensor domain-containing protein/DNA-binding response OmpR family regulator